jgi:hypothetical protein
VLFRSKNAKFYLLRGNIQIKLQKRDLAWRDFVQACKMGLKQACQRADMLKKRIPRGDASGDEQPPVKKRYDQRPRRPLPPGGE